MMSLAWNADWFGLLKSVSAEMVAVLVARDVKKYQ